MSLTCHIYICIMFICKYNNSLLYRLFTYHILNLYMKAVAASSIQTVHCTDGSYTTLHQEIYNIPFACSCKAAVHCKMVRSNCTQGCASYFTSALHHGLPALQLSCQCIYTLQHGNRYSQMSCNEVLRQSITYFILAS